MELSRDLSTQQPLSCPHMCPSLLLLAETETNVFQVPCVPCATLSLGSGLNIPGINRNQMSPRQHRSGSLGLLSPWQAVLLLPLSPEAQGDPTALAGPADWGAPAKAPVYASLLPEWDGVVHSVN